MAVADVDERDWDRVAATHGGTGNTLVVAVVANLLRRIRPDGGADAEPISIAIPIYARDRYASGQEHEAGTAGVTLISAKLDVPAGPPRHDGLGRLRAETKAAFVAATAAAPRPASGCGCRRRCGSSACCPTRWRSGRSPRSDRP